jgi:peptide/nickel transport system ATP-binding protein
MDDNNVLEINNLSVDFRTGRGRVRALRNVNLAVPGGKVVGLVGESGCGKSTVIISILRLLPLNAEITSGSIIFEGQNILQMTDSDLRAIRGQRISVVFQDPMTSLNPVLSIGKQMMDIQYRDNTSKKEKHDRAIKMLQQVRIPDPHKRMSHYAHQFSGGMRQRIAIAMALLGNPALLIADEPTTALDATLEMQIIHLLRELQSKIHCSILFVSHHIGLIAELCNFVAVMYAGEVVEYGSVREVLLQAAHPYTRKLLECDPALIKEKCHSFPTIPGEVSDLVNIYRECVFVNRCSSAIKTCRNAIPGACEIKPGHIARCHLLNRK